MYCDAHTHLIKGFNLIELSDGTSSGTNAYYSMLVARNQNEWVIAQSAEGLKSLGVHPWWSHEYVEPKRLQNAMDTLERLLQKQTQIHIGEIGLDFAKDIPRQIQENIFIRQLELAQKYNRTVSLHVVRSYARIEEILNNFLGLKVLIHGYRGSLEWMKQMESKGCYFSFGKEIFSDKSTKSLNAFLECSNFLLETDEWEPTSEEYAEFYQKAAKLKGMSEKDFQTKTAQSFQTLFLPNESPNP